MAHKVRLGLYALLLILVLCGCAHQRAALPPPVVVVPPDTTRLRKPEAPAFPQASLDTLLSSSALNGAKVAVQVVSVPDGNTLYARDPGQLLTPASVQKLLTSAAALYWLSPQFQFRTEVRSDGGDLFLRGGGDPSLTLEDLRDLARDVRRKEPGRIRHLILDGSYLDTLIFGQGWSLEDTLHPYHPTLSAFVCEHNFVTLIVRPKERGGFADVEAVPGSRSVKVKSRVQVVAEGPAEITIRQRMTPRGVTFELTGRIPQGEKDETFTRNVSSPARFSGDLFKESLLAEGIRIRGSVEMGMTPPGAKLLAEHKSQPLAGLLRTMNKESDNLYAETVLKTLGAEQYGPPGTAEKGLRAVKAFLDTLRVKPEEYRLVDGSGLSRSNALSPEVLVRVLAWMYQQFKLSPEFVSTLPMAGKDGTLIRRLYQVPGLSRAKTGTLKGVSSIAGYAVNKRGEVLAFAILVNGYPGTISEVHDFQDEVVKRLNAW